MADLRERLQSGLAGRYRIQRELGQGGMATVYLAQDLKHDRPVALKVLRPELAATLGPERFQREIKVAARLQHPHILPVFDSGEASGQLWYTMPYVEGESVRARLRRELQLPLKEALQITHEAAAALQYAHEQGVIHRDVKPENILLTKDGSTLIADFGIARGLNADAEHLTKSGIAMGTPAYMSPEQAAGEREIDARTDVYALGCVLYEMLAGEPPYTGPTPLAILAKAFVAPVPSVRQVRATVPSSVDRAVMRALAKLPADRFDSASQFAHALPDLGTQERETGGAVTPPRSHLLTVPPSYRHRRFRLTITLATGAILGLSALFAWQHARGAGARARPKLLAVLPFENLGPADQDYFTDGMTDEVRGKLAAVGGLELIARGSSAPYRKTSKTPQQIAQELGVRYLLTAVVRWEAGRDGQGTIHMSPELVEVRGSGAPVTRWQQLFDVPLTNIFEVQADIASRVAEAMDVALGDSAKRQLAEQPTRSLPAFDAFLKGEAASQGMSADDPPSLRLAVTAYEQAVALDSTFVLAWAQLARARAVLYLRSTPSPAGAEAARQAAERALVLGPNRSEGHQARAYYYADVLADNARAFAEDSTALALTPGSADLLSAIGVDEFSLGRFEAARAHFEQSARLDPRSVSALRRLGLVLLLTRHYPEARQALDRAARLAPTNLGLLEARAMVALAQGDLTGARAVLAAAPKAITPTDLVAYVAGYQDLEWVLDDAQQRLLLRLMPSAFDDDRAGWGLVFARTYTLRGDPTRARAYADSARLAFEQQLEEAPQDPFRHLGLGLALAYLGRTAEAIAEGERGAALLPLSKDAFQGTYIQHQLVLIYLHGGEPQQALTRLEPLLKIPCYLSPGWLKIDPNFAPLRGNPRFERLVNGK